MVLQSPGLGLRVKGAVKRFTSQGLRVEWSQEAPLNHQTLKEHAWCTQKSPGTLNTPRQPPPPQSHLEGHGTE